MFIFKIIYISNNIFVLDSFKSFYFCLYILFHFISFKMIFYNNLHCINNLSIYNIINS